jgi:hypothetical protein
VKFTLNILDRHGDDEERRWPNHMFGGRMRTSTLALIVAFLLVWWLYDTYRPHEPANSGPPPAQVVPPGFVPDPNYTWVPRTRVEEPPPMTFTPTPTTTTAPPSITPPTTTTSPPPFVVPTLPCIPPFCTPSTTPVSPGLQLPQPGPPPVPTSAPPAQ